MPPKVTKKPDLTQKKRNPTNLVIKLVTGDTHTVQSEDFQAVVDAVGDTGIAMIAFHFSGKRVYIPCRAIVSMVESTPSESLPPGTWTVDRS